MLDVFFFFNEKIDLMSKQYEERTMSQEISSPENISKTYS